MGRFAGLAPGMAFYLAYKQLLSRHVFSCQEEEQTDLFLVLDKGADPTWEPPPLQSH